ncbi:helix-turn-helix domain-containing protein [Pseudomonas sp. GW456-12-1-14-TSB6]|uniref:helix-turn-helix domain-containing protein n=1 Tax=unclassified Pseudomonas TaxID=196821 RepID=UPI000CD05467|nr:AraC family transcriptional regulator [Pseudomonas sp. GW456-12-1-14-TSB6]POA33300.1 AraC family transcriptional regulator [Pseudomonas sp. GW456-12-1-14-TSB6]
MSPQSLISDHPRPLMRPLGSLTSWQERRAKELMFRDLSRSARISEIAGLCNLSRSHFSRAFKKNTGYSPQEWWLRMKIEKAKSLLITSMPITEVVYECGFSDHSHFTRTFNRLEGMPPREWRRAFVANRAPIALQLPAIELDAALWSVHNAGHAHPSHA